VKGDPLNQTGETVFGIGRCGWLQGARVPPSRVLCK
jgi:hypothetical protein